MSPGMFGGTYKAEIGARKEAALDSDCELDDNASEEAISSSEEESEIGARKEAALDSDCESGEEASNNRAEREESG